MISVTEVRINKIENPTNSVIGYASVAIDNAIVIRSIQLMEHDGKRFLGFPTKKSSTEASGYTDVAFPCTKEAREYLTNVIFEAYDKAG